MSDGLRYVGVAVDCPLLLRHVLFKYVEITYLENVWDSPAGPPRVEESMAGGVLVDVTWEGGAIWLVLDWGFAVRLDAVVEVE